MGGESIVYDAIGNPTTYRGASLAFTGRRLQSYAKNGTLTSYRYDADGIRTQKTAGNTRHEYESEGGKIYREQIFEDNTLQSDLRYFYDAAGRPAMLQVISGSGGSSVYYYGTNAQGDVIAMYDSDGNLCVSYLYDAWGNLLSSETYTNAGATARSLNSLLYRGYYFDSETGFYYVSSRYYDPEVGRWINADNQIAGVGGEILGYNMFAYCMNNPVNLTDPDGNWPRWITRAVAITSAVLAIAYQSFPLTILAIEAELLYQVQCKHFDEREALNIDLPNTAAEAEMSGWKNSNNYDAVNNPNGGGPLASFHQYTAPSKNNVKYISPDGHKEVIYNASGQMVTDSRDIGTYNYCPSGGRWNNIGHFFVDILPWCIFGNNDSDPGPLINGIVKIFER